MAGAGAAIYSNRDKIADAAKDGVSKAKDKAINAVNDKIQYVGDKVGTAVQPAVEALEKAAQKVQDAAKTLATFAKKAIEAIKRLVKTIMSYIPGFKDPSIIRDDDIDYDVTHDQLTIPLSHSKCCDWIKQCDKFMNYVDRYIRTGAPYPDGKEFNKCFRVASKNYLTAATERDCKYSLKQYASSSKVLVDTLNASLKTNESLLNSMKQKADNSKTVLDSETIKDLQMIGNIQINLIQSCDCINAYIELVRDMSDDVKNAMVD